MDSFPGMASGKEPPASARNTRDLGSIPGLGRSPGGGRGNPLQYSCLENPMDRGAWPATVHGVANSRTRLKRLSTQHTHPAWRARTWDVCPSNSSFSLCGREGASDTLCPGSCPLSWTQLPSQPRFPGPPTLLSVTTPAHPPADHPATVPERATGLTHGELPPVPPGRVCHLHRELS